MQCNACEREQSGKQLPAAEELRCAFQCAWNPHTPNKCCPMQCCPSSLTPSRAPAVTSAPDPPSPELHQVEHMLPHAAQQRAAVVALSGNLSLQLLKCHAVHPQRCIRHG